MGFGSVSNEIKGKRDIEALGMKKSLLKIGITRVHRLFDLLAMTSSDQQMKRGRGLSRMWTVQFTF